MSDGLHIPLGRTQLGDDMVRVAQSAIQKGIRAKEFIDEMRIAWNEACDSLKIKEPT